MRRGVGVLAVLLLCTAATATNNLTVSGTVTGKCSTTGGSLTFGNYNPLDGSSVSITGSISVSCTRGTPNVTIQLDNGKNAVNATLGMTRAMASGANYLSYELYKDPGHSTVWNTSNTVSYASSSMAATTLTVYGYIPASQDVAEAALYSDQVTATVNF